ncbi:MAG: YkgJ family cysteine cluster protein [Halobacteriales archaeon]
MPTLEAELAEARSLSVGELADAIESIGFECTRCGACCKGSEADPHTATVFPDETRRLLDADVGTSQEQPQPTGADDSAEWRDVVRPTPFGLDADGTGETFEWALQTDACGDCAFYDDGAPEAPGTCTVYPDRPLICQTYPFSVDLAGSTPMGAVVDTAGPVNAHECEGLGREIDRADAESLAATLKHRAVRELEEAIAVREQYEPADAEGPVVHDSEGAKRPDGSLVRR